MTATDLDPTPFLAALVAAPGDPLPLLVFADYLEGRGEREWAMGCRWAARHGKRPARADNTKGYAGGWYPLDAGYTPWVCRLPLVMPSDNVFVAGGTTDKSLIRCWRLFLDWAAARTWGDDGEPVG